LDALRRLGVRRGPALPVLGEGDRHVGGQRRVASRQRGIGDPDSSAANGDDCACFERVSMSLQHLGDQGDTLQHGNVREAYQASMLEAPEVHEFSEIRVDRNQNPRFGSSSFKQCLIARIAPELAGLEDIMSLGAQPVRQ
jgi:hypothetical protein